VAGNPLRHDEHHAVCTSSWKWKCS
jgi:hypothetical protein